MTEANQSRAEQEELGKEGAAFLAACRENLKRAQAVRDRLKDETPRNAPEILSLYNELERNLGDVGSRAELYQSVSPDAGVRKAAELSEQESVALSTELSLDRELYEVFAAIETDIPKLDALAARLLTKVLRDFRRSGVDRDEAVRNKIRELNERLVTLSQDFERNIREDTRSVEVSDPARLAGLPADFIDAHKPDENGIVRLTTDWADFVPVLTYAEDAGLREELWRTRMHVAHPANGPVLADLLAKRHELATLLGYDHWADYATEELMIRKGENAGEFIEKVAGLARNRGREDRKSLLEFKRRTEPEATDVFPWERMVLLRKVKEERYAYDPKEAREYFEVGRVVDGILAISSRLFGVEFRDGSREETWHESVRPFEVMENGRLLGKIFLDLHPRENKYKHAAMFNVVDGLDDPESEHARVPVGAIVANFPDPTRTEGRALMEHGDVVTLFHEFGHLLHHVFGGRHKWLRFSGVATEWDFVEVPSQLYEEWGWETEMLQSFAVDARGRTIPAELVEKMRAAKDFGLGEQVMQQMFYASVSLGLYNRAPGGLDVHAFVEEKQRAYSIYPVVEDTYFENAFGHLVSYSSNYYTYMWSLVIAKDLAAVFREAGLNDAELSMNYRKKILDAGGSKDAAELVKDFLGRDFRFDAFEAWLG